MLRVAAQHPANMAATLSLGCSLSLCLVALLGRLLSVESMQGSGQVSAWSAAASLEGAARDMAAWGVKPQGTQTWSEWVVGAAVVVDTLPADRRPCDMGRQG